MSDGRKYYHPIFVYKAVELLGAQPLDRLHRVAHKGQNKCNIFERSGTCSICAICYERWEDLNNSTLRGMGARRGSFTCATLALRQEFDLQSDIEAIEAEIERRVLLRNGVDKYLLDVLQLDYERGNSDEEIRKYEEMD